ncbi:MAG: VOC family protein [Oscillospiraceae bacterium]|jgi:lactoylglutathione lyase|nr:VOC family protein [Oscillospiraceae bacterium]
MGFRFIHSNRNVADIEKSAAFYAEALGLQEVRRHGSKNGTYEIVFMEFPEAPGFRLELTWMQEYDRPYDLGDNEIHLAVKADDYAAAYAKHKEMGCICYENPAMGIYFIADPDGYWTEICP